MDSLEICNLETLAASARATVTRTEASRVLGVDVRTVSRAIEDGQLPSLRIGRRLLIPRLPLLAMLTEPQERAS